MLKYVNYHSQHMFIITMFKTELGNYKVEVCPCVSYGFAVSDPIAWDVFSNWWSARKYVRKQYKKMMEYVNGRC